jgi:hypothetical protein
MICKEGGCEKKARTMGWCGMHYTRWYRHGDPNIVKGHGYTNHPLYRVWAEMKTRCYNENRKCYKDYGGRGIIVCNEWKNDPVKFIKWAKLLWEKRSQIDRKDNNGNYCPENCRFVTRKENVHNQRLLREDNTSGYRGVSKHKNQWRSRIAINNKSKHLGCFDDPKEAALAYDNAVPDNRPRNFNK